MAIEINLNSDEFKKFLDYLKTSAREELALIMEATAIKIHSEAVIRAPGDDGDLKQSINYRKGEEDFSWLIGANAPYAAYVEFGTRFGELSIPEELKELALKFKADPLIKATNIDAQPYMYPALVEGRKFLIERVRANFKKWTQEKGE